MLLLKRLFIKEKENNLIKNNDSLMKFTEKESKQ